jgi:hypothetical protein
LPFKLNIVLAIIAAIVVGIVSDRRPIDTQTKPVSAGD